MKTEEALRNFKGRPHASNIDSQYGKTAFAAHETVKDRRDRPVSEANFPHVAWSSMS